MAGLTVRSRKTSYYLIEVVSMAGLTVRSHKTSYYLIEVVSIYGRLLLDCKIT